MSEFAGSHMRGAFVLAAVLLMTAAEPVSTQRPSSPLPPRLVLPDVSREESEQAERPRFRTSVTRVEVSALVLDGSDKPVHGLTADDFEVLENGVPQVLRSFEPFTFSPSLGRLPDPILQRTDASKRTAAAPASNYYTSASRIFALILDDLHVSVRRTRVARDAARRLVDQLAPTDLLLVMTTGSAESTGYFTRDREQALRIIERFTGQRLLDKRMAALRFPGHDFEAERIDHYERLCATIRDVSLALRTVTGRRKTVILVTEGSSFGAGMSDMTFQMPTPTNNLRANVPTGSLRVMNEALAAAAAGNVAIYPVNPAGLDLPDADIIEAPGLIRPDLSPERYLGILTEARQAKEMVRDLAALTGGVSSVDTNDLLGGIDRAVRDASLHYVLSYEPQMPPRGTEYRSIVVKVRRPGLRVLARRGYRATGAAPPPRMKVPGSLSSELRLLLSGVVPDDRLPMRVHAVPVGHGERTLTVAVVVEIDGSVFAAERGPRMLKIEQGLLTVDRKGRAAHGTRRRFDVALSSSQWAVLAVTGLRTVWAIDVQPGSYQLRVASLDTTTNLGGSVYLELDVPERTQEPRDALVGSRVLSVIPTPFADKRLAPWTAVMPTAMRVFPQGDVLTVTLRHSSPRRARATLSNAAGEPAWEGPGSQVEGASAVQFVVPLGEAAPGVYDLTIQSGERPVRMGLVVLPGG